MLRSIETVCGSPNLCNDIEVHGGKKNIKNLFRFSSNVWSVAVICRYVVELYHCRVAYFTTSDLVSLAIVL